MMNRNFGASPDLLVNLALSAGIHLAVLGVFVWAWPQDKPAAREDVKTPAAAAQTEAPPAAEPSAPRPSEAVPAQERVALTPSAPAPAPAPAKVEPRPAKPKPKSEVKPAEPETEWYTVQKGDTLTAIARGCGCKPAELARLNGKTLKEMENIQVGRKIKVLKSDATP